MSQIIERTPAAIDAATWANVLQHTGIQLMLAGTSEFDPYMRMREDGIQTMLLADLYPYDHTVPVTRLIAQVTRYPTDERFIQLLLKMMREIHYAPRILSGLWSRPATPYQITVTEPGKTMDLYMFTFDLVKGLDRLYRHKSSGIRKRHVYKAACDTGEEFGRFALNLTALTQWVELSGQYLDDPQQFTYMVDSLTKMMRRLHKVLTYKGADE